MSKLTQTILLASVLLIVVAVMFNSAFVIGGSGVVLLVAVGYAYVVSRREAERGEIAD
ncbi:hypothetical protein [Parerythrobacter lacustris]|uniref:Uncharacterized protein n=1 Tax=Parerythrobacter lacustris TaxID=2969984 RepID=A0ABT1XPZ9_9SPHN|nr:hypothetical protein [Parerythrobacter lacustris]MCR2833667.1 hypothetical protein [Parerythrobacter lacustris]